MMKTRDGGRRPWNQGRIVGQKRAFSMDDLAQIESRLLAEQNWHDLALLGFGLDTMLRASDLLATSVAHVTYPNRSVRTLIPRRQKKTRHIVNPVLTPQTRRYLAQWLQESGKRSGDFLFTRSKGRCASPISRGHYADVIKNWAEWLGYPPEEFSSHSIRRTKPAHMYWAGEDIALISRLLGHKSIAATIEYLGITQHKAEAAALRHSMLGGGENFIKT